MVFANADFPVDDETREWLDARISWIVDQYGLREIRAREVATLNKQLFEGYEPSNGLSLRLVLDRLCEDLGVSSDVVEYSISDDDLVLHQSGTALGTYHYFNQVNYITVGRRLLADPHTLLSTLVHELGHVLLIGHGRITGDEYDHEPLTDLLMVFMGYGPILANSVIADRNYSDIHGSEFQIERRGYLTMPMYGYALAVLCRLRDESAQVWRDRLRPDVRDAFMRTMKAFETSPPPDYRVVRSTTALPSSYMLTASTRDEDESDGDFNPSSCVYCGEQVIGEMETPVCRFCQKSIEENQADLAEEMAASSDPRDIRRARMWYAVIGIFILIAIVGGFLSKKS